MAFIPAAERYNLMADIDRVVIDKTLGSMQNANNRVALEHCSVSINLSAQSLCDDDLLDFILERITGSKVSPDQLCFEITETSAIVNLSRAMQFIIALKQHGCRFSLDDFGSGLSSFGYLKNLPVDYLKIDGCFVRDIADDPMDRALVESINQIGHVLGIKTIAEYVENDQILQILKEIGVDYGQGYGISKPQPLEQLQPEQDISATATV
jgi:EAL domain-containing protein (putative c-di-GMP-specific phosphodiesterase class I)